MSFQYIINAAESISVETKKIVASSITRSGIVRSVSRGNGAWKFSVKLPDGLAWSVWRSKIAELEKLDRTTSGSFYINATGHSWISAYQGNSVNSTGFVASIIKGNTSITLTTSPTTSSGYKFRAGDLIQLGSTGKVYTVTADVVYNSNTVNLHRPILEDTASGVSLRVGANCQFTVICTEFPQWTLFARDQVSWSGPFVFNEVIS